jgi:hypothetical protein
MEKTKSKNPLTDISQNLNSIVIGIRFRPNFAMQDKYGTILENILHDKKSYFNPNVFPKVRNEIDKRILFNPETNSYLSIDNENIILDFNVVDNPDKEIVDTICNAFDDQIIHNILKEYSILGINRIGYIKRYDFESKDLSSNFINKTIGGTLDGVNDIHLRFSKKIPDQNAIIKEDINDYHNAIYTVIKKSDEDILTVILDYQKYFIPPVDRYSQIEFDKFRTTAENYNNKNLLDWVNLNFNS